MKNPIKIQIHYGLRTGKTYEQELLWGVSAQRGVYGVYHTFRNKPTAKQLRKMVKFCKPDNWGKELVL